MWDFEWMVLSQWKARSKYQSTEYLSDVSHRFPQRVLGNNMNRKAPGLDYFTCSEGAAAPVVLATEKLIKNGHLQHSKKKTNGFISLS